MKVAVTLLREKGRILRKRELPAPVVGDLVVDDWPPFGAGKRWKRRANLLGKPYGSIRESLLLPIFDPQIMKADESGLYLQGTQICGQDGDVIEFVQVWRCVASSDPHSEPSSSVDPGFFEASDKRRKVVPK